MGGSFFEGGSTIGPFFDGPFFGGGFFGELESGDVARPRPADNERRIYKPTGLLDRKTVKQRVAETREIHREVRGVLSLPTPAKPIKELSLAEIDAEIGARLREQLRKDDEDIVLMLLIAAAG